MKSVNNISKSTKKTAVQKMSINENAPSKRSLAHLPTVHSSSECDVTICQTVDLKPTIDETCIMHW